MSKYLEVVHGNLIDSNMFLRSVFLTMDHCMEGGSGGRFQQAAVFFPTSKFFSWFLHLRRRVCYLALLVSSISVDTLTLENVSCLNTALIILMLAARQGTLANCLKMLATATIEQLRLGKIQAASKSKGCLCVSDSVFPCRYYYYYYLQDRRGMKLVQTRRGAWSHVTSYRACSSCCAFGAFIISLVINLASHWKRVRALHSKSGSALLTC